MKANRSIRENKKGVAPTLTILLVIPVILMIISAIALWAQHFIQTMQDLQDEIHDKRELLESLDIGDLVNNTNVIYSDDFEYTKVDKPQWETNKKDNVFVGNVRDPINLANISYYSGHLSCYIKLDGNEFYLKRSFENKCYGLVSVELAFTVDSHEAHKVFKIYENDEKNIGEIKIDISNSKLVLQSDTGENDFATNVNLHKDKLCWHTMKLVVDFESRTYISFTLDGNTYLNGISGIPLSDCDESASKNPDKLTFEYRCNGPANSETWVDDFVICNLSPYKDINVKWV